MYGIDLPAFTIQINQMLVNIGESYGKVPKQDFCQTFTIFSTVLQRVTWCSSRCHPAISIPKPELKGLQTSQKLPTKIAKWSHPSLSNISDLSPTPIFSSHLSTRRKWNELWAGKKYQIPLLLEELALFLPCPPPSSGSHPQWKPPKDFSPGGAVTKAVAQKDVCFSMFFYKYGGIS